MFLLSAAVCALAACVVSHPWPPHSDENGSCRDTPGMGFLKILFWWLHWNSRSLESVKDCVSDDPISYFEMFSFVGGFAVFRWFEKADFLLFEEDRFDPFSSSSVFIPCFLRDLLLSLPSLLLCSKSSMLHLGYGNFSPPLRMFRSKQPTHMQQIKSADANLKRLKVS